jgi:hypothetical protein
LSIFQERCTNRDVELSITEASNYPTIKEETLVLGNVSPELLSGGDAPSIVLKGIPINVTVIVIVIVVEVTEVDFLGMMRRAQGCGAIKGTVTEVVKKRKPLKTTEIADYMESDNWDTWKLRLLIFSVFLSRPAL